MGLFQPLVPTISISKRLGPLQLCSVTPEVGDSFLLHPDTKLVPKFKGSRLELAPDHPVLFTSLRLHLRPLPGPRPLPRPRLPVQTALLHSQGSPGACLGHW